MERTGEKSQEVVHVLVMLVLLALVPEGAEGDGRSMQPSQLMEESLDRLTAHASELHNSGKGLLCDCGSRMANKVEQLLQGLL